MSRVMVTEVYRDSDGRGNLQTRRVILNVDHVVVARDHQYAKDVNCVQVQMYTGEIVYICGTLDKAAKTWLPLRVAPGRRPDCVADYTTDS